MGLISDIRQDLDASALQLITEYRDRLFAEAVRLCADMSTAEDLVSRTLDKAIRNLESHRKESSVFGWMKSIMLNLYRNDNRSPVVRGTTPVDPLVLEERSEADWTTDEEILRRSDSQALREALGRLDPEFKRAMVLHYLAEMPVKQIAAVMNAPVGTVLWRLSVARKILARDLGEKLGKKPVVVLLAALLGISSLFGAWQAGLLAPFLAPSVETPQSVETNQSGEAESFPLQKETESLPLQGKTVSTQTESKERQTMNLKTVKTLAASAVVAASAAVANGATTDDYVPEGLVAMWDGYENDGAGGHATELTEWKDVKGNYGFTLNNVAVEADRLVFSGDNSCYGELSAADTVATFEAAKNGTIEIVLISEDDATQKVALQSSANSGIAFGSLAKSGSNCQLVTTCGTPKPITLFSWKGAVNTFAVTYENASPQPTYVNGGAATMSTSSNNFSSPGTGTILGNRAAKTQAFKGSICAIRLYSTKLTPEQIATNRAIDVKRFIDGDIYGGDGVFVKGAPEKFADGDSPAYGWFPATVEQEMSFSAPDLMTVLSGGFVKCLGWKLYDRETGLLLEESKEGDRLNCSFAYSKPVDLVWQWKMLKALTVRNFDADLATVYVNDQPTTNGQQVAVDGTVKIELKDFRNDYYFRYAPETQTDRELAFDCWEGVPEGYEGANPATFTADGDLTITPNVNVKGYKWRLSDDRTAVENQYFRWNVTIPAKSTDRTVSLGVFIANLVGSTVPSLPLDCVQRVEVDGKNYTITGVSGPDKTPFFAENSYIDSIVLPWRFTTIGNYLAKGSNFVITNLVGLAEANVTTVGSFVFNSNTTTDFRGPVGNFVPMHAETIGSEAYSGRSGMTGEMVLTDIKSISQQAFRTCSGLTSMRLTSPNLKSLGSFTFWNCSALTDITLCASNLTSVGGNCIDGGNKRFTFIGAAPSWAIATTIVQYQTAVDGAHAASLRIDPTEPSWWDLTVPPTENEVAAGLPEGCLGVFVDNVGARKAWVIADGDAAGATLLETDMTRQDGNTGYVTHGGLKQGDTITLTAPEGLTKCELQHLRDGYWTTETVKTGETVIYTHGGELTRAVWGVDGVTLGVTTKGYKGTYSVEVVDGEELGSGIYSTGAKVRVTAIGSSEHPRSAISAWSGDVPAGQETNATIELTLEKNTTVEALFRPLEWLYDPAKKTITDGEYTSKAGDGNTNVDYEYGMYFQGFTAADYTLWLDFSIPIYNPNDPEHDYWIAKVSGSNNNQSWRHVRFGTNITTVAGEMFYYSSTLEDVEGFGKTRVVNIPANFFRAIGLNKQTRDASEFVPETLTNINTYSYLDAPELTGTLRLRITNLEARGSIRVNGCTNFEFLAEGVTNAASFKTVVAPERVLFASTNLVTAAQGAFNKNLKDLVFCAHAPTAAALDNILYSVATTNATVHCSKYAPGWKAMRATGYSAMDEWDARPAGCWGIYQTADGKKRFYLVQRDSKYDVRTGFSVILK